MLINTSWMGVKRIGQTLPSGAQRQGDGQQAHTERQEIPSEYEEELLSLEVPEPLEAFKPAWM